MRRFTIIEWLIAAGILLAVVGIWAAIKNQQQWEAFAAEHNCKVISSTESSVAPIVGGKDVHMVIVPGSKTYLCDDGVKYTRSN